MKPGFLLNAAALAMASLFMPVAHAALISCSFTPAAITPAFNYVDTANLDAEVSGTVTCTRSEKGGKTYYVRINLSQSGTGASMATGYPDTLNYGIFRDSLRANRWTSGAQAASGASGVETTLSFSGNATSQSSAALTAYMRVPSGQTGKAAGSYSGALTATLQELTNTGTLVQTFSATGTLTSTAAVGKSCVFGAVLPSYALSYQAFRNTDLTDATQDVDVTCTKGTSYTLTLDATSAVVPTVNLRYGLVFTGTGGATTTGASTSGSAVVSHGLTLTLPAGQAGSCTSGSCSGTSVRTITVTY